MDPEAGVEVPMPSVPARPRLVGREAEAAWALEVTAATALPLETAPLA